MQLQVQTNLPSVAKSISSVNRQAKFAGRLALNDAGFKIREGLGRYAAQVFDKPVNATIKAGLVKKAPVWGSAKQITTQVYLRNEMSGGVPPGRYLQAQIRGGGRNDKSSEKRLHDTVIYTKKWGAQQILPRGWQTIVHKDYQNSKGNITKGMIQKIMADLRAFHDPAQSRADGVKGRFFVIHPSWNIKGMTPGIYERKGKRMKIVLIFKPRKSINYTPRYNFHHYAYLNADRNFAFLFKQRFAQAMRTARM